MYFSNMRSEFASRNLIFLPEFSGQRSNVSKIAANDCDVGTRIHIAHFLGGANYVPGDFDFGQLAWAGLGKLVVRLGTGYLLRIVPVFAVLESGDWVDFIGSPVVVNGIFVV